MSDPNPAAAPAQFRSLLRSFALDPGPLTDQLLTAEHLARVIAEEAGTTRDRIFTPAVTTAVFLGQVLSDDHSCQAALDRLIAWRAARGCRRAPPTPAATARRGGGSPRRCCPGWPATPPTGSRAAPPRPGGSTAAASSSPTARR